MHHHSANCIQRDKALYASLSIGAAFNVYVYNLNCQTHTKKHVFTLITLNHNIFNTIKMLLEMEKKTSKNNIFYITQFVYRLCFGCCCCSCSVQPRQNGVPTRNVHVACYYYCCMIKVC